MFNKKPKYKTERIIKGCIASDYKAQRLLYKMYAPKMFSLCLRYAKDYHQAEDILQEGFVKIYKNIHKFRGTGSFDGWVRRIFVNTAIEAYRKSVKMYPIIEVEGTNVPLINETIMGQMGADEIMALVDKLAIGYKTIFNLYVVEGYPHKDIAEKLGISEGTSKSQLARARYMLQKMILERDNDAPYGEVAER